MTSLQTRLNTMYRIEIYREAKKVASVIIKTDIMLKNQTEVFSMPAATRTEKELIAQVFQTTPGLFGSFSHTIRAIVALSNYGFESSAAFSLSDMITEIKASDDTTVTKKPNPKALFVG